MHPFYSINVLFTILNQYLEFVNCEKYRINSKNNWIILVFLQLDHRSKYSYDYGKSGSTGGREVGGNMGILGITAACAGALVAAGTVETVYFYRRTMKRQKAKTERTIKMAGTDWSQYADILQKRKE